ncbi:hypothetical protein EPJ70_03355 [Brachyspira aalborgi]|uniref:Lipocalin-like domain-containing protein n=1 Tax=Brachyspira aalborgi TaxID=29522 RepID=A0A5C8F558_9SPIR|nr:hypothetical protein [Brachyspira aalborgi]TXJ45437.1 hypothetical protein EPJ70_03355 [Brachyspira aalborgi]
MKSKQIIIMLLSFIILFAISCKNDDKTGGGDVIQTNINSNHPPAGSYTYLGSTNTNNYSTHTVSHSAGACKIAGIGSPSISSALEYEITIKSWLNYSTATNLNYVGTSHGGEYTITKPTSRTLDSFDVIYDITNESIEVYFRTQDGKYYSTFELKKVN